MCKIKPILILTFLVSTFAQGWFSDELIDCTLLLEKKQNNTLIPHGTGFFVLGYKKHSKYLVTCEHILRDKSSIYVTLEADSSFIKYMHNSGSNYYNDGRNDWELNDNILRSKIDLILDSTFVKHSYLDIAAFPIEIPSSIIIQGNDTIKIANVRGVPKSRIRGRAKIKLGEDVFFLGFPFMIGTKEGYIIPSNKGSVYSGLYKASVSNPVIRSGIIGWISEKSEEYLLDAFSYSGNSGSPVFSKLSLIQPGPDLIGMVIGHLNEEIEFEENSEKQIKLKNSTGNSGLAICLWMDDILSVIEMAEKLK